MTSIDGFILIPGAQPLCLTSLYLFYHKKGINKLCPNMHKMTFSIKKHRITDVPVRQPNAPGDTA